MNVCIHVFRCCKARFSPPMSRLLCGDPRSAATQYILLDLAGGSLGQFSNKRERLRHFEVCHAVANEGAQLLRCCALPCLEDDKCVRCLAPLHIGQTHDRDLLYRWVTQEHTLNLDRGDILASTDDHIL